MLLISVCVLCLKGLSHILWAFWAVDQRRGVMVLGTGAFKCILNVSLRRRWSGDSLEARNSYCS